MCQSAGIMQWLWLCCVVLTSLCASSSGQQGQPLPWWRTAVFYQVYPRSFKDSDGDGVGDLKGIEQMADYFKEIGVDAIWLSPILQSPMADFGYDISNYTAIDPLFGTMDDFDSLLAKMKSIGVKLLMDFVPNHSSDQHLWFQKSSNPSDPQYEIYKDYYVWRDKNGTTPEGPVPPNNWCSLINGIAWAWHDSRQQFYLHKFIKEQPDLNFRNADVLGNMTAFLEFWLDKGIDGFRMDAVRQMYEDESFRSDPAVPGTAGDTYATLQHLYDQDQSETFHQLRVWADLVFQKVQADGQQRALFLEVYDNAQVVSKYYGTGNESLEFPFNFNLLTKGHRSIRAPEIKQIIDEWMSVMPQDGVANWVIGNHDNGRVADRYGPEMVDALNMLTGVLPGVKVVYYGEELGMQNTFVRYDQTVDPKGKMLGPDHYLEGSRDPERTPMQWDDSLSAGFSSNGTTWLPVNPNYWWLNVAAQRSAEESHLKVFQAIAAARRDPVLQTGGLNVLAPDNDTLIVLRNQSSSYYALIINMASEMVTFNSQNLFAPNGLDIDMSVVVGSLNSGFKPGMSMTAGSLSVTLRPKAAVLLRSALGTSAAPGQFRISSYLILLFSIVALLRPFFANT